MYCVVICDVIVQISCLTEQPKFRLKLARELQVVCADSVYVDVVVLFY